MDAATALPNLARGILDGVTRCIGLILGKGLPFVYPPSWVPAPPCRALGNVAYVSSLGHVLVMCCVKVFCEIIRKVVLALVSLYAKFFVLVLWPRKIAFPSTVIVVSSQCHSKFLLLCFCRSALVSEVDGVPVR